MSKKTKARDTHNSEISYTSIRALLTDASLCEVLDTKCFGVGLFGKIVGVPGFRAFPPTGATFRPRGYHPLDDEFTTAHDATWAVYRQSGLGSNVGNEYNYRHQINKSAKSEERRGGKECVSTGRSRGSP